MFLCHACRQRFSSEESLSEHIWEAHPDADGSVFGGKADDDPELAAKRSELDKDEEHDADLYERHRRWMRSRAESEVDEDDE